MTAGDEKMQLFHYPDDKALLNQRAVVFAKPGTDTYLNWKRALFAVISSVEDSARASGGIAELDKHYRDWAEYVRDKQSFWRWYADS